MTIDQQFVEYIIKSLVSEPDAVNVVRTVDEKGVLLTLTVAQDDLGRVIGKRGTTAQSLRTLLRALGTKNEARYNLKIVDLNAPQDGPASDRDSEREQAPRQEEQPQEASEETADEEIVAEAPVEEESTSTVEETTPDEEEDDHNSVVSKTRRELEELDDLDI